MHRIIEKNMFNFGRICKIIELPKSKKLHNMEVHTDKARKHWWIWRNGYTQVNLRWWYSARRFLWAKIKEKLRHIARACLKNHFRNLQAPLCGIFYPHSVAVARYAALIRIKSPTNWDSQLTKSLFQTRSSCYSVPEKFFTDDAYSDGVIRVNFLNCREKYW